ncbi:hypothetical protein DVH24_042703 [Malus domestica]|uniref:Uncharacterized protein n=1 Tax=Malus domestica TaxID=3750 RepID=A0A498HWS9_MALDO|nr:hypothetical protein DVH24_042703 [Malus domestica]
MREIWSTPSPAFFSGVRYRNPIAPFNEISRYFQNIAILSIISIISRYLDKNYTETSLNIHYPKNRYYRRYFADNIDI